MKNDGIIFLHGSHTPQCDARVAKHYDGYCTLQYISRGRVELFYDNTRYEIAPPTFWPASPGPFVRFHPAKPGGEWEHRYIAFRGPIANRWLAEGLLPSKPLTGLADRDYSKRMDELISLAHQPTPLAHRRAANLLEGILLELAEASNHAQPARKTWLDEVLGVLADPDNYPVDYDTLAARLGMATSTLRRRFRLTVGMPMHAYALLARLTTAQSLLLNTDLPIKHIASRLSFRDVYFFTRQFAKHVGLPPRTVPQKPMMTTPCLSQKFS